MNEYEKIALEILKNRRATRAARARRSPRASTPSPDPVLPGPSYIPEAAADDNDSNQFSSESDQPSQPADPPPTSNQQQGSDNNLKHRRFSYPTTLSVCRDRADFIILGIFWAAFVLLAFAMTWLLLPLGSGSHGTFSPSTSSQDYKTPGSPEAAPTTSALQPPPPVRVSTEVSIGDYECHDAGTFYLCNNGRDGSCLLIFGTYPTSRHFGVVPLDIGPKFLSESMEQRFYRYCRKPALWFRPAP